MSVVTLLNLNSVCYDYNIPDEVIKIIKEYIKSHTLHNKIGYNLQFLGHNVLNIPDMEPDDPIFVEYNALLKNWTYRLFVIYKYGGVLT